MIRRSRVLVAGALSLLTIVLCFAALCMTQPRDPISRPETGYKFVDVAHVERLVVNGIEDFEGERRRSFTVPRQHWQDFLSAMQPSERNDNVPVMSLIAQVTLTTTDGTDTLFSLYENRGTFWFSIGHNPTETHYYHGPSLAEVRRVLASAYNDARSSPTTCRGSERCKSW